MNIIFLGPPGSGKGTQAKRLATELSLTHISTGDVFRDAIGMQSELGKEIKAYVENGKLVPDELVSRVVFEHLKKISNPAFLLDGYPRTVDQAKDLDLFGQKEKRVVEAVVFFDVESSELIKRLTARRQCRKCKDVFNLITNAPKKELICDTCGGELYHREDDKEDVIRKRLEVYEKQTAPVLNHYRHHSGFLQVDAKRPIDDVYQDLISRLRLSKAAR